VVAGFADESACSCPVGLLSGVRQIVNGHIEAAERNRSPPQGELDRALVGDTFGDHMFAAELLEPIE
jgi:hypothetical protein